MAQRRMFSLKIIDSDMFIDMPQSSRLYYYDLSMRADDDGFVSSPKKIMKITGASEDDLKILIAKLFIIPFNSGICVIKDWKIHNYIQSDRYSETHYTEEKKLLSVNDNGSYVMDTKCIQDVNIVDTQVRLGKDRIGKVREGKDSKELDKDTSYKDVMCYYHEIHNRVIGHKPHIDARTGKNIKSLLQSQPVETIKSKLDLYYNNTYWFNKDGGRDFNQFFNHYNEINEIQNTGLSKKIDPEKRREEFIKRVCENPPQVLSIPQIGG
jgi:hypothetical protein